MTNRTNTHKPISSLAHYLKRQKINTAIEAAIEILDIGILKSDRPKKTNWPRQSHSGQNTSQKHFTQPQKLNEKIITKKQPPYFFEFIRRTTSNKNNEDFLLEEGLKENQASRLHVEQETLLIG